METRPAAAEPVLPLRWESTGDQWWYATPIDLAAAGGHYDLVRELLRLDANLLVKLTSLRRIRRLESVWDDDARLADAARNRAAVARRLLHDCDPAAGGGGGRGGLDNRLVRAGYGGWLIYTAAAAGDAGFVRELLAAQPLLVFGEGEYGVTDILYAAARSGRPEVFRLLLDAVLSPASCPVGEEFRGEMMNRAVHAAARGGNLVVLRELLRGCSDAAAYRDAQGSTILHAAAARGQVEVCFTISLPYFILLD
jgi:ankyrin repeat protein